MSPVRRELSYGGAERVVVVGCSTVVTQDVLDEAEAYATEVVRVAGDNRYETSANVAAEFFGTPVDHAFMASGATFPDALSSGPVAALHNSPVLLTRATALPAPVLDGIVEQRVQEITIAGGYAVVARSVEEQLDALVYP